ncbi:MAG: glycoside hydrolase family 127 protein [Epulopiscium sp.]|nr:glycoside hydrolase family 127 protein [Candidatus Epulonipiscium sp.]
MIKPIDLKQITINEGFWKEKIELIKDKVIPYQWKALNDLLEDTEPSHSIDNFKIAAGIMEGEYHGMVFQDSDLYKWLEAVAYVLNIYKDSELESKADEMIELIGKAQLPDGYLNTYFTVKEPDKKWTNLKDWHELYCAGHFIEAVVAYYQATGKSRGIEIASRLIHHIESIFGPEEDKMKGYPGHEEIEYALIRLYRITKDEKALKLAKYFIEERGKEPKYFKNEAQKRDDIIDFWERANKDYAYYQAHKEVKNQEVAVGHAVRAVYFYTSVAALAAETGDRFWYEVSERLWENITNKQMYITAGIGSSEYGEAFTIDYDLPNDLSYTETCASIGLAFWASEMLNYTIDSKYADVIERAIYNGTISGMSLDGTRFFYVNPLEVWPRAVENRHDLRHVKPERQKWYGCACCPPNIARMTASVGRFMYSSIEEKNKIYIHQFASSEAEINLSCGDVKLNQKTNYPWDGDIEIDVNLGKALTFSIYLRMPSWCKNKEIYINNKKIDESEVLLRNGYVVLNRLWNNGDKIQYNLEMKIQRVHSNPKIWRNAGKIALQRGPIVYCLEEVDNGSELTDIAIPKNEKLRGEYNPDLLGGVYVIKGTAKRSKIKTDDLYFGGENELINTPIIAIPYYAWVNRTPGEMLIWIREM